MFSTFLDSGMKTSLETSCKVGLQPEGFNYHHSETVIN